MSAPDLRPVVFTDIDDTLCQSAYRLAPDAAEGALPVARSANGSVTLMTAKQQGLLAWLAATTELVPVTARSVADFRGFSADFGRGRRIVANGAVILDADGRHDDGWSATMATDMAPYQETFGEVVEKAAEHAGRAGHRLKVTVTSEFGMSISAVFSVPDGSHWLLGSVREAIGDFGGWHTHLNGNTLALTPPPVSKRRAVLHLLSSIPNARLRPVIGFGDSLSDLGFMSGCDFISTPSGSQISSALACQGE